MAASTASRIAALTLPSRFITRETVLNETPASRATSLIVGRLPPCPSSRTGFDKRRCSYLTLETTLSAIAAKGKGAGMGCSAKRRIGSGRLVLAALCLLAPAPVAAQADPAVRAAATEAQMTDDER